MEESLYTQIFCEIQLLMCYSHQQQDAIDLARNIERLAIQSQIDLLNKMRDVLDIPQDQHECFMNEVDKLQNQLDQSHKKQS